MPVFRMHSTEATVPRANRRKLHRAQRLAAEARKAAAAAARRHRAERHERVEAAILDALARPKPPVHLPGVPPRVAAVWASVQALLRLASVPPRVQRRVEALVHAVGRHLPERATVEQLPWLLLLARQPWQRDLSRWSPPSGSASRKADDLAHHLLARYPVPPFLIRSLDVAPLPVARIPEEDEWAVGVLAWVGAGRSLQRIPRRVLPTPLTKRMRHAFLTARARTAPVHALRSAQLVGHGAPPSRVRPLLRTRLSVLRGPDPGVGEPFWDRVIAWYAARPSLHDLDGVALERVLAWLEHAQREALDAGRVLDLSQRPEHVVVGLAEAWHAAKRAPSGHFPRSGLLAHEADGWSMVELTTPRALREEGRALSHCVGAYVGLARKRRVSLWSLRWRGERRATVEVALPVARVVQAKGRANRKVHPQELAVIAQWAADNRLTLAL